MVCWPVLLCWGCDNKVELIDYIVILAGEKRPSLQYPVETVVPMSVTNEELTEVANFHR